MIWCTELSNHERYNVILSNITNTNLPFLEAAFKIPLGQKLRGHAPPHFEWAWRLSPRPLVLLCSTDPLYYALFPLVFCSFSHYSYLVIGFLPSLLLLLFLCLLLSPIPLVILHLGPPPLKPWPYPRWDRLQRWPCRGNGKWMDNTVDNNGI